MATILVIFFSMQIGPYGLAFKRKIQMNIYPWTRL